MNSATNDWFRQPLAAVLWWCLPLGLGVSTNFLAVPPRTAALVWTALLAWMGTGCVLNALRCYRLHCYISGPIFLLGGVATALFAAGLMHGRLNNIISAALVLALFSFVPEIVWTRYKSVQH